MSVSDISQTISAAATFGLLVVAIIGVVIELRRKRPKPKSASRPGGGNMPGSFRWIPWVLVVVALASTAVNWRISQTRPAEEPKHALNADNARIIFSKIDTASDDKSKSFAVNYVMKNDRKTDATHVRHIGLMAIPTVKLDDAMIDGLMLYLQITLSINKESSNNIIEAGQENQFFSVPDDTNQMIEYYDPWINNDHTLIYSMAIIQYNDGETEKNNEHIYTEACGWYFQHVRHFCNGHNGSYISK